jgi:hypothetical protein
MKKERILAIGLIFIISSLTISCTNEKYLEKIGNVTVYDREKAYQGYNLYQVSTTNKAALIDMQGRVLHYWTIEGPKVNLSVSTATIHIWPSDEGKLLFIILGFGFGEVEWNSSRIFFKNVSAHHDIRLLDNKTIMLLTSKERVVQDGELNVPVKDDFLTFSDRYGKISDSVSLIDIISKKIPLHDLLNFSGKYYSRAKPPLDVLHINKAMALERDYSSLLKKGRILFSARNFHMIGLIDRQNWTLVWSWGHEYLDGQHSPEPLENGHILIFDDGIKFRNYSRVIEMDPETGKIVWNYTSEPKKDFHSYIMGWVQKLPNGNILVTEAKKGRVFELDKDKKIVWEYYTPINNKTGNNSDVYRMTRISKEEAQKFGFRI